MKRAALWLIVFWFALVLEQSRPDLFPPGSIFLPTVCARIFWSCTASGMLLSGVGMLLWLVINPTHIAAVCTLSVAGGWLAGRLNRRRRWSDVRRRMQWIHPILALLMSFGGYLVPVLMGGSPEPWFLVHWLCVGISATVILMIVSRLAEELGLRRQVDVLSGQR